MKTKTTDAILREAVGAALEHLESHGVREDTYGYLNEHVGTDGDCPLVKLHKRLKNALALPRRNCDIGTAEEQGARAREEYNEWRNLFSGMRLIDAVVAWSQMPYKKGEAK